MGDPSPAAAEVYYQRFDVRVLKADGAVPPDAGDVFVVHSRCDSEDARDKRGGPASATPTRVLPRDGPLGDTRRAIIKAAALPPAAQREARVWLKVAVEDDRQTDAVGPLGEQRFWKARAAADDDDGWLLLADDDDDTLLGLILRPASKARRWGALVEARCADGSWPRDSQWRAALRVGQVVDARDSEGRWFDAIVIDLDAVKGAKVHFRGWSSKWDAWLGLHPNDAPLAKLFTHTDHWRMLLRREDACEVRSEDAVKPLWYEGRVTDIDAGGRVEVSPLMAGTAASRHMAPRWVETTSEEICKMGTHIKKALPRAATAASAHGLQDRAIARGTIHETKEDPPPAAAGPMPCCICDEPGGKRCTTCKSRCYCSKACQLVDWKERGHKAQCKQLTPEFQDRLRGLIELMSNLMKLNIEEEPAVVDVASAAGFNAAPRLPTGREEKTAEGEATTLNDDAPDWLGRRGTCPICHDLLPSGEGATFYNCCCQSLCTACSVERTWTRGTPGRRCSSQTLTSLVTWASRRTRSGRSSCTGSLRRKGMH
ncbi:hypothetical protein M885DRAFT_267022 [Pelagophyceae sp. CCMP2097]|nr:hypothetical protein M885DRAFT_267022 [Pelagophyceae sp. CCMP2097]